MSGSKPQQPRQILPTAVSPAQTVETGPFGGWKANALRHSFISFYAATEGLAKTAMIAGNSESEARKSYNDSKSPAEAKAWFGVVP
jgi:hypothetical protein